MKKSILAIISIIIVLGLTACGEDALNDGTYEGVSSKDDDGGYATVSVVVKNGEIESVDYKSFDEKDQIKDENYGKDSGNDQFYKRAQTAVAGMKSYQDQINEKKHAELVEAVSGATISYGQFIEAMDDAMSKAK